jgi:O-acetyl-ADP-ribose deacetylase (regulator of RNase III)
MPIVFVKGDIFETDGIRAYAFGANTDGTLNVGIAIAFKKRWPAFAAAYETRCAQSPMQPGEVFMWSEGDVTVFALCSAQGEKKPSFSALTNAVRRMLQLAVEAKIKRIGVSRIGGVDWTRARKMLNEVSIGQSVQLDVFEQFIRAHAEVKQATEAS